ncbi:Phosphatidate cytidylyltransferase [Strongyloides ratti]|uniref:Phosphatidate cytidylyltransferase n=1 Tax=Strongyloides ratti TaxID=34506 RepID=A0A090MWL8_STRRB|nr:Phosphatidate cytidylyltransferase [Strongyloides ratti]CEF63909.1 Phosphatidate cytidylyltransferase [Strongyloides ratti]
MTNDKDIGEKTSIRRKKPQVDSDSDIGYTTENEKTFYDLKKRLPQSSDKIGFQIDQVLLGVPERWRNYVVRLIFTVIMISLFSIIINKGPLYLVLLVIIIQFKCFHELIKIGLIVYRLYDLPWFRTLSWYFLLSSNYFFFGEYLIELFKIIIQTDKLPIFLVGYHRFVSFCFYCIGFIWFVLSLKKGYYLRQFSLFAWTHVALMLIVVQSYFIIENILQGIIWFLIPVSMIICCDVMSYFFGFFFGKTPLIALSPKKTWEGFIGGGISTVIFGLILSSYLMKSHYMICPLEEYLKKSHDCDIPDEFTPKEFEILYPYNIILNFFNMKTTIVYFPFTLHALVISLFASIIGPFGGFFASGFKRAFKIKDFGDIIPGHGGLMDRFDCQLLIGTFTHVYIISFIRTRSIDKIMNEISRLTFEDQQRILNHLQDYLNLS